MTYFDSMTQELLRLLLIEDSEDDALLVCRALRRGQFELVWQRVQSAAALREQLATRPWDVIISDYSLPGFDAPAALEVLRQSQLDIPFIVVSGTVGESMAVEVMKAGAQDYVMKGKLTRLPEAIRRELREAKVRIEQKKAERVMKQQLEAIEAAVDGIGILQGESFIYVNSAYLKLFGYHHTDELLGQTWKQLYSAEEINCFVEERLPTLERNGAWQGEAIATRKDGSTFVEELSLTLTEDGLVISVCRDISAFKAAQAQLLHNALHDPLTDLPNRNLLEKRLESAILRAQQVPSYNYAVLFVDLDRFKIVNDSLGHIVGDQLLQSVAQRLKAHLRNIDLVARFGGDEFVILLENVEQTDAVIEIAQRIIEDCRTPYIINNHEIVISLSIGVVWGNYSYHKAADLIRDADIAMFRAKAHGLESYQFFDAQMHTQALERLLLENDLRKAIDRDELLVYYQPIFDIVEHRLVGFEALVRWQHASQGLISPAQFIPIAEETGLLIAIDSWVFSQACQQMALWQRHQDQEADPLKISINLSVQDFCKTNLLQEIDDVLTATDLKDGSLTVEITESMLIEDINQTIELFTHLAAKNIQISIDDFGTGYSNLHYLHRLPVHNLKIDHSFVSQMQADRRNQKVVNTIVALSHQLGLTIVAEGIETSQQRQQLQQLGCHFGQGYFFSKPLPPEQIETHFRECVRFLS